MQKKKFAIIDGNAIIHRAYHALPPLTTKDGTMVNAVFGFISMMLKVLEDLKPDYIAVSFDVAGKTFRDDMYAQYKATRVKADQELYDQIPLCFDAVRAFNIPIYTKEGYEADDVIGTVSKKVQDTKDKIQTYIVTGDMDMLQLVSDEKTLVYELRRGLSDIVIFDEKKVREKYGFGPEHIVDYKALRGDVSDNIPGVHGIGEKGAQELIEKVGGIEEIYKEIKNPKSEIRNVIKPSVISKLEASEKDARMSKELATIVQDVKGIDFKLEDCRAHDFDIESAAALLKKFEFFSLLKRIPGYKDTKIQETRKEDARLKKSVGILRIVEQKETADFVKEIGKEDVFACREVLGGGDVLSGRLEGLIFVAGRKAWYVKGGGNMGEPPHPDAVGELPLQGGATGEALAEVFADSKKTLVGHDLKQLIKALTVAGVEVKNTLFDVMIASYLLDAGSRHHDLRAIALRELGEELPDNSSQGSLFGADPQTVADELSLTLKLKERYEPELAKLEDLDVFSDIEMPLISVLAEMELAGVAIDVEQMKEMSRDVARELSELTKKIHKEAGEDFNPASSVQLREVLFEKIGLPSAGIKKGKTGLSTSASELEKLRGLHPIIELIEEHRELAKLQNTYVDVLPGLVKKSTGRIHTSFNQAVAATGRLSSSDPNLQNIPIRTELGKKIRDAFVAERGYTLVTADYSQIELRIVAHLAHDKKLIDIFKSGQDVHTATASIINGVPESKVTREMRYAAKEINFGVLYGMGAYGLAWRARMPQWQAKDFIDKYFEGFSGVKAYIDETLAWAKKKGYVETLFGRRRYIPELKSDNYQLRSAGERMAVNMPVQGTAADLMKKAMISVRNKIQETWKAGKKGEVRMILQVHDELVLEVKKGLEEEVGALLKKEMEQVISLDVPIVVHVAHGKRWGELK